jgi:hypothetical protein
MDKLLSSASTLIGGGGALRLGAASSSAQAAEGQVTSAEPPAESQISDVQSGITPQTIIPQTGTSGGLISESTQRPMLGVVEHGIRQLEQQFPNLPSLYSGGAVNYGLQKFLEDSPQRNRLPLSGLVEYGQQQLRAALQQDRTEPQVSDVESGTAPQITVPQTPISVKQYGIWCAAKRSLPHRICRPDYLHGQARVSAQRSSQDR